MNKTAAFNSNGFLVVGPSRISAEFVYHGMDTDAWPLPLDVLSSVASSPCYAKFCQWEEKLWTAHDFCFMDEETAKWYASVGRSCGYRLRILYAEADLARASYCHATHSIYAKNETFLGYDVGDCAANMYSSLLCDILLRPELLSIDVQNELNSFGLFAMLSNVDEYLRLRDTAMCAADNTVFEGGRMSPVALYETNL